jgi:hypothetical protein
MRFWRLAVVVIGSLFCVGSFSPPIPANEYNRKTVLTFHGPFEIPGLKAPTVLPAGTYVFRLVDLRPDRDVVQIFNQDQTQLYATIQTIPNYRMRPTDKTVIKVEERVSGSPEAIMAWFYPGEKYGREFVYSNAAKRPTLGEQR